MSGSLNALEVFLTLSQEMTKAAEGQEWEELAKLGAERKRLSDQLPADLGASLPPQEQARGRAIIERCQQLDTQIYSLVDERQKALRILLREPAPVI